MFGAKASRAVWAWLWLCICTRGRQKMAGPEILPSLASGYLVVVLHASFQDFFQCTVQTSSLEFHTSSVWRVWKNTFKGPDKGQLKNFLEVRSDFVSVWEHKECFGRRICGETTAQKFFWYIQDKPLVRGGKCLVYLINAMSRCSDNSYCLNVEHVWCNVMLLQDLQAVRWHTTKVGEGMVRWCLCMFIDFSGNDFVSSWAVGA